MCPTHITGVVHSYLEIIPPPPPSLPSPLSSSSSSFSFSIGISQPEFMKPPNFSETYKNGLPTFYHVAWILISALSCCYLYDHGVNNSPNKTYISKETPLSVPLNTQT